MFDRRKDLKKNNEMRGGSPQPDTFNAWDPAVVKKIDELVQLAGGRVGSDDNSDLVREMIVTALKAQHTPLARGDVKILSRALRELRYGFRIFQPFRHRKKVTIFGSARTPTSAPEYKQARDFARRMAKEGYMSITGAGGGIMRAGNEGAGAGNSFGVSIRLPFEQIPNEYIRNKDFFIDCRFFFTRKLMFLKETNAVAVFPGGFGSHDEGMESLTLVQTGKCDPIPLVFINPPGSRYWKDWLAYIKKHLLKNELICPEDLDLFKITDSVEEAVEEILNFYKTYHSMRFVGDRFVIRLQRPLDPQTLKNINRQFRDICLKGAFTVTGALPEENEYLDLPRLVFTFKRVRFGRVRQLINYLNSH